MPLPPENIPGTHFCQRLSQPQGHSAALRIMSMKNLCDPIGNRTRDLLACSAVPQPTACPVWAIKYAHFVHWFGKQNLQIDSETVTSFRLLVHEYWNVTIFWCSNSVVCFRMLFRDLLHKKVGTGCPERTAQHQNAGRGKFETQTCNHPIPQCRNILVAVKYASVCLLRSPLVVHHIWIPQLHKSVPCNDVCPKILHVLPHVTGFPSTIVAR